MLLLRVRETTAGEQPQMRPRPVRSPFRSILRSISHVSSFYLSENLSKVVTGAAATGEAARRAAARRAAAGGTAPRPLVVFGFFV